MVHWEHRYLLGTMVFTIAGDVVRDFDEEYEAWSWLEQEGWGLVAIEPPDPVRPGVCKYYFKRQRPSAQYEARMAAVTTTTGAQPALTDPRRGRR
ncbi:MAG TPA: hypothetical protein VFQ30_00835 [Ktedonobacteraceae bacterium]|nr:hypothetical protein [Ktedonobacteraceae bacterium]